MKKGDMVLMPGLPKSHGEIKNKLTKIYVNANDLPESKTKTRLKEFLKNEIGALSHKPYS